MPPVNITSLAGQLARQNTEVHGIEKSINDMKHDTVKLNTLICKEKGSGDILVKNQKLSIKEFEASLKVEFNNRIIK